MQLFGELHQKLFSPEARLAQIHQNVVFPDPLAVAQRKFKGRGEEEEREKRKRRNQSEKKWQAAKRSAPAQLHV